ncbi:MAG: SPOR domain-containing protein [Rubrivivax sp.]|nr:SPOR domain-containing protein [Rubrivivax sp.]
MIEEHRAEGPDNGVVAHPDGWYWVAPDGHQQFGPFASAEEARADRDRSEDLADPAPGLSLAEVEEAIGINAWIDPDTGEPAEGRSPPHLDNG